MLTNWQPIETAPKDGTKVLLWVPELNDWVRSYWKGGFIGDYWVNQYGNGPYCHVVYEPNPLRPEFFEGVYRRIEPTHWMLSPTKPKNTE